MVVAGGLELVDHGVLPGKHVLDALDGACSVPTPYETFRSPGETLTGRLYSRARRREVGYTIAYPPGHSRGSRLPLGLYLHADDGSHTSKEGVSISNDCSLCHNLLISGEANPKLLADLGMQQ